MMIDFAFSQVRQLDESNTDWRERKRSQDEEGAVGFVMQHKLQEWGHYTYKASYRYDGD